MQIIRMEEPYEIILGHILHEQHELALKKLHDNIHLSVDMKTICVNLHNVLIKNADVSIARKFKYLRVIGESEWRSDSMTPKVLASWMIGQMI